MITFCIPKTTTSLTSYNNFKILQQIYLDNHMALPYYILCLFRMEQDLICSKPSSYTYRFKYDK